MNSTAQNVHGSHLVTQVKASLFTDIRICRINSCWEGNEGLITNIHLLLFDIICGGKDMLTLTC